MSKKQLELLIASRIQDRQLFGSRAALFAGFGTLLTLTAIMSIDSLHTLQVFEVRQDYLYREHTLEQVRTGVYVSGRERWILLIERTLEHQAGTAHQVLAREENSSISQSQQRPPEPVPTVAQNTLGECLRFSRAECWTRA